MAAVAIAASCRTDLIAALIVAALWPCETPLSMRENKQRIDSASTAR